MESNLCAINSLVTKSQVSTSLRWAPRTPVTTHVLGDEVEVVDVPVRDFAVHKRPRLRIDRRDRLPRVRFLRPEAACPTIEVRGSLAQTETVELHI